MTAFGDYQLEIYLAGKGGVFPALPMTFLEMERRAKDLLAPEAYSYVAGSAGSERTETANRAAFDRYELVPRHLRGAGRPDLSTDLFGAPVTAPLVTAPVGALEIVHAEADRAVADATRRVGVPFTISTLSSVSLEDAAQVAGDSPRWFQLYWPTDKDVCRSFVQRAERAGYGAIVLTVDTWQLAWRPRDLKRGFLPFLQGKGMGNYFSDPAFRATLAQPPEDDLDQAVLAWAKMFGNPGLQWSDLDWLREQTELPLILKGICHPDDAKRAERAGVDGIVVSNHGGRQVDGARACLDCLVDVVAALDHTPILFDSGVRSGSDAAKALALGAKAVMLGRPFVYGLAAGGSAGVEHVLRCLLAELDLTIALCGFGSTKELDRDCLRPAGP